MKELSIEEKAKAYDEALKRAKMSYHTGDYNKDALEMLEIIFPELAESEGERIREALIEHVKGIYKGCCTEEASKERDMFLAWLEKQGEKGTNGNEREIPNSEQKPTDKVEPKFKVGDKVYALRNRFECTIESIDEITYYGDTTNFDIKDQDNWKLVEQKPAELAKGEDYGIDGLYAAVDILQKTLGNVEGYQTDDGILAHKCAISAVTELSKQKPVWSEEDEETLGWLCTFLKEYGHKFYGGNEENVIDWLNSLKERYTWKPSDLPHWKKITLSDGDTIGFYGEYFCHKGYKINYKELFEKLPKDD